MGPGGRRFESAHPDHALDGRVSEIDHEWQRSVALFRTVTRSGQRSPISRRQVRAAASSGAHGRKAVVQEQPSPPSISDEEPATVRQMPLGIVIARILVVSGMAFAAAFAIFFLVGGLWLLGLISIAATLVFLVLMFAIERGAEGKAEW